MADREIGIDFYLGGLEHAHRFWRHVPRVGETVIFAEKDVPLYAAQVLWRERRDTREPYVEIELTRLLTGP